MAEDIEISEETRKAYAKAYFAETPEEFRQGAKETVEAATKDCIKHVLKPVVGKLAWVAWAQETARRFA
jgi:hypothetical protein